MTWALSTRDQPRSFGTHALFEMNVLASLLFPSRPIRDVLRGLVGCRIPYSGAVEPSGGVCESTVSRILLTRPKGY